jgi:hypothetical protein
LFDKIVVYLLVTKLRIYRQAPLADSGQHAADYSRLEQADQGGKDGATDQTASLRVKPYRNNTYKGKFRDHSFHISSYPLIFFA